MTIVMMAICSGSDIFLLVVSSMMVAYSVAMMRMIMMKIMNISAAGECFGILLLKEKFFKNAGYSRIFLFLFASSHFTFLLNLCVCVQ